MATKKVCSADDGANCDGTGAREFLNRIGDKWTIFVIVTLAKWPDERARFSDLKKSLKGISHTMLSSTLKNLERDGMVKREVFPEVPPRVEYELTKLGLSVLELMKGLVTWTNANWATVRAARERYDKKTRP